MGREQRLEASIGRRAATFRCPDIVGRSTGLQTALEMAHRAAEDGECNVLLTGETGTGKELVAQAIHAHGIRKAHPFTALNAAAVPAELAESLLFGHERGAYTDATDATQGLFAAARGGTVFLDEIQELDPRVQAKLLRFLQDRHIIPLGGEGGGDVDVRIIAASNQDLSRAIDEGRFRSDLYFRLAVFPIHIPPLRERPEDIPLLVDRFLGEFNGRKGHHVTIGDRAMEALAAYEWPGNVRELRNLIERLVILCRDCTVHYDDLPSPIFPGPSSPCAEIVAVESNFKVAKQKMIAAFESAFIMRKWEEHGWHIGKTAEAIGESREWLGKQIRKHGLQPHAPSSPDRVGPGHQHPGLGAQRHH